MSFILGRDVLLGNQFEAKEIEARSKEARYRGQGSIENMCDLDVTPLRIRERNLWAAVLERAIRDYCGAETIPMASYEEEDLIDWFYTDNSQPGSLIWICEWLDFNPAILRKSVEKMKTSSLSTSGTRYKCLHLTALSNRPPSSRLYTELDSVSLNKAAVLVESYQSELRSQAAPS